MTEKQWRKVQLRLRQLLRQKNGIVQFILVEQIDGTLLIQVVGGPTETIVAD